MATFYVRALRDPDAQVFYSETDVPGLTVEADTLAKFQQRVLDLAPEVLTANTSLSGSEVTIRFSAERELALAVA